MGILSEVHTAPMSTPAPTPPPAETPRSAEGAVVATGWLAADSMFGSDDRRTKRAFGASVASFVVHGLFVLLAVWAVTSQAQRILDPPPPIEHVVFLNEPGPGGGGGGSPAPAPPKPMTIPKVKAPDPVPIVPPPPQVVPPPPAPMLTAPIINSDVLQASGPSSVSALQAGGGGRGSGIGSGTGSGVGPGRGGGFGDGVFSPGAGISNPVPIRKPSPPYTPDAMRMKVQGAVDFEAIVRKDGTVAEVRLIRSLDKQYGMDEEARKAALQWLFTPARDKNGNAVDVKVVIGFDLRLH